MSSLRFQDLEAVHEALALAIDRAGPEYEALLLAKLALVLAHELGDCERFARALEIALRDLPLVKGP